MILESFIYKVMVELGLAFKGLDFYLSTWG